MGADLGFVDSERLLLGLQQALWGVVWRRHV